MTKKKLSRVEHQARRIALDRIATVDRPLQGLPVEKQLIFYYALTAGLAYQVDQSTWNIAVRGALCALKGTKI